MQKTMVRWRWFIALSLYSIIWFGTAGSAYSFLRQDPVVKSLPGLVGTTSAQSGARDTSDGMAYKTNPVPKYGQDFFSSGRSSSPYWRSKLLSKSAIIAGGFFTALLIIAMFIMFYIGAKNGSEADFIFKDSLTSSLI